MQEERQGKDGAPAEAGLPRFQLLQGITSVAMVGWSQPVRKLIKPLAHCCAQSRTGASPPEADAPRHSFGLGWQVSSVKIRRCLVRGGRKHTRVRHTASGVHVCVRQVHLIGLVVDNIEARRSRSGQVVDGENSGEHQSRGGARGALGLIPSAATIADQPR